MGSTRQHVLLKEREGKYQVKRRAPWTLSSEIRSSACLEALFQEEGGFVVHFLVFALCRQPDSSSILEPCPVFTSRRRRALHGS